MIYIKASNHILNVEGCIRCSKYFFQESKENSKWWIELAFPGESAVNISLNSEKEWLDAFDSIAEALQTR
jgi:hypothetical protein